MVRLILFSCLCTLLSCNNKFIDADGDGLSDKDEIEIWGSNPEMIDSDSDGLSDGIEINVHYTSPIIMDTDGDGLTDFKEINEYSKSYSPIIANTPLMEIDLTGTTQIRANTKRTGESSSSKKVSVDLEYGKSNSTESQDTSSHEVSAEISASVKVEAEASLLPSANVTAEVSASAGYAYTNTSSVSNSSSSESRQKYGQVSDEIASSGWELVDGELASQINIKNTGDLSFTLEDITVTAILRDLQNSGNYKSVAQLSLNSEDFSAITLGPNESRENIRVSTTISGDLALDLLAEPERLMLEVNHFELSKLEVGNEAQTKFSYLQQETTAKTAYVHIDYGRNQVIRKRVATNIRKTNGSNKGEKLSQILKMLDIHYETKMIAKEFSDSIQILNGLWNPMKEKMIQKNDSISGFWTVVGSKEIKIKKTSNFDDILVPGGSAIYLIYVIDEDNDGLFASEEFIHGTYDNQFTAKQNGIQDSRDYDGDGLTDGEEVKNGWEIPITSLISYSPYDENGTWVYSNPKNKDQDQDGLNDFEEKQIGTDPNRKDTDNDKSNDNEDKYPTDPQNRGNNPPIVEINQRQKGNTVFLDYKATHESNALKRIWMIWDNTNNVPSGVLRPAKFEGTISYKYPKKGIFHGKFVVHDKYGGRTTEKFTFTIK